MLAASRHRPATSVAPAQRIDDREDAKVTALLLEWREMWLAHGPPISLGCGREGMAHAPLGKAHAEGDTGLDTPPQRCRLTHPRCCGVAQSDEPRRTRSRRTTPLPVRSRSRSRPAKTRPHHND